MKLRSIFFNAVFFSVGIAFTLAEEPVDENTFRENTYSFGNPIAAEDTNASALSFYHSAENKISDMPLFERDDADETGRDDYTTDYRNEVISPAVHETSAPAEGKSQPIAEKGVANDNAAAPTTSRPFDENKSLPFYDFSISFFDSVTDNVGFTAREGKKNPLVFFEALTDTTDISQLPENESFSSFSFAKDIFTKTQSGGHIIFGGAFITTKEEDEFISFISVLAAPFAILTISVCVGLLVVIFTSSGKKANV